jgi:hypothetical protein
MTEAEATEEVPTATEATEAAPADQPKVRAIFEPDCHARCTYGAGAWGWNPVHVAGGGRPVKDGLGSTRVSCVDMCVRACVCPLCSPPRCPVPTARPWRRPRRR